MNKFESIENLKSIGFTGFKSIAYYRSNLREIPTQPGIYIVFAVDTNQEFLEVGSGGFFKGKDPNVEIEKLKNNWVDKAHVLYIGQVSRGKSDRNLLIRIDEFLCFGNQCPVAHSGGKYIWQLKNHKKLLLCFCPMPDIDPKCVEAELLYEFKKEYNKLPFANNRVEPRNSEMYFYNNVFSMLENRI